MSEEFKKFYAEIGIVDNYESPPFFNAKNKIKAWIPSQEDLIKFVITASKEIIPNSIYQLCAINPNPHVRIYAMPRVLCNIHNRAITNKYGRIFNEIEYGSVVKLFKEFGLDKVIFNQDSVFLKMMSNSEVMMNKIK